MFYVLSLTKGAFVVNIFSVYLVFKLSNKDVK